MDRGQAAHGVKATGRAGRRKTACLLLLLALCPPALGDLLSDAQQGDAQAQFKLGTMHLLGRGASQDYREAARWLRKAAAQGHSGAQYNLGLMYEKGAGVKENAAQAEAWYLKAATQGNTLAQLRLGLFYEKAGNRIEAYRWFLLASRNNNVEALDHLEQLGSRMTQQEMADAHYRADILRKAVKY